MNAKTFATILAALLLAACSSTGSVDKHYSGYLKDYYSMARVETADGSDAMRWVSPDLPQGKYRKVIVEPVSFFPAPMPSAQVRPETLRQISTYLTEQIKSELGRYFEITETGGADTVHLQVAITGVDTPREGLKVYELLPIMLVYAGATTAMGKRDNVTLVYVEGQLTDSQTGEVLVKGVRQGMGENLKDDQQQLEMEDLETLLNGWAVEVAQLAEKLM